MSETPHSDGEDADVDFRLEGLAHRTAGVKPSAHFQARVLAAIEEESGGFGAVAWGLRWRALPVAMLVASAALLLAVKSASSYDDALVNAYDESSVDDVGSAATGELEW